eukprot:1139079-Pelagomonas_calceolata.AAC.5
MMHRRLARPLCKDAPHLQEAAQFLQVAVRFLDSYAWQVGQEVTACHDTHLQGREGVHRHVAERMERSHCLLVFSVPFLSTSSIDATNADNGANSAVLRSAKEGVRSFLERKRTCQPKGRVQQGKVL